MKRRNKNRVEKILSIFVFLLLGLNLLILAPQKAIAQETQLNYTLSELRNRDFSEQNLQGASFAGADVRGSSFKGANLKKTILTFYKS